MSQTLSEFESKQLLAEAGIAIPAQRLVFSAEDAVRAAEDLCYPVVLKLCGRGIAHKTERDLIRLELLEEDEVHIQAEELLARRGPDESDAGVLVTTMLQGRREVIAGLVRDPQFGPCVMLGLGGVFAEALEDVAYAVAPLGAFDADDLIDALEHSRILGRFRSEPEVDRAQLDHILETLGRIGLEQPQVRSIDINPLILIGSHPVIADALVELEAGAS